MASIKKRPDGRYRARYRGPDGQERAQHFDKKAEAQRWLDSVTTAITTNTYAPPERSAMPVGDWADKWIAGKVNLKPSTRATYKSIIRHQIKPRWQRVPLGKVAHEDIGEWVTELHTEGLSASRTRQVFTVFAQMLDGAVKAKRLGVNPARGVDLPRLPMRSHRYLSHAEVRALADHAGEYRALVMLLAYGGLRFGEAAALRVRNVDVLRARVTIAESVTEVGGVATFTAPKTHAMRTIPIPRFVAELLAHEVADKSPDDFVFQSPRDGVLREGNWRRRCFDAAASKAGLGKITPHALRHSAASLAISAGAHVVSVSALLGHASSNVTLGVYSHLFDDDLSDLADRLDAAAAEAAAEISRTGRGLNVVELEERKTRHAS